MKTINPVLILGSYLGLLAGLVLYLLNLHPFWWVVPFLGVEIKSLLILDLVGGTVVGYSIHILSRVFNYHINKTSDKK
ncbi:MAG: hypothetical protein WC415_03750 [Patescibacteria group bacterium]|jgi:hypothetical protein